jgi:putative tryptophan/tyrosine transport system substrate-binding protein
MRRRELIIFLGSTALARPLAARAQQQPTMHVVGFLSGRSLATDKHLVAAFRQGLNESGYVEGQNVTIDYSWAEGQVDRLPQLAADLVGRQVSAIFAGGMDVKLRVVKDVISTIPVVFATGGDPVELGLVASMNRPGGTATAVTVVTAVLSSKRLELLHRLLPSVTLVALLVDPNNPTADTITKDVQTAAQKLGLQVFIAKARSDRETDDAFAALARERAGAVLVTADPLFIGRRPQIISLANRYAVPAIYDRRDFPEDGGLMSYGASIVDQYYQSGRYVGRILKGERPGDLPVIQPTKFELVINAKTAKSLGMKIPDNLLALADEVIE